MTSPKPPPGPGASRFARFLRAPTSWRCVAQTPRIGAREAETSSRTSCVPRASRGRRIGNDELRTRSATPTRWSPRGRGSSRARAVEIEGVRLLWVRRASLVASARGCAPRWASLRPSSSWAKASRRPCERTRACMLGTDAGGRAGTMRRSRRWSKVSEPPFLFLGLVTTGRDGRPLRRDCGPARPMPEWACMPRPPRRASA